MLTLPAVAIKTSSNYRLDKGPDRSTLNLPSTHKPNVTFTHSTRFVPDSESTNKKLRPPGKREKVGGDFDPDKIAAEVRYKQLQEMFCAAEFGLDIDEFKVAMRKTVGHKMTDDEIEFLFMKVDANSDERVEWEEYVTYNLLEYQGKARMIEMMREHPFPPESIVIPSRHRDVILAIEFYPTILKRHGQNVFDHATGRYVTLSKDGVMSFWNIKMKHLKSYHVTSEVTDRLTPTWMVDMALMYNVGMVAVTSTDRDITIYDIQGNNFFKRYYLTGIDDCITCMHYWVDLQDMNHSILCWGDTSGSVCVFVFQQCLQGGPFGSSGGKAGKRDGFKQISIPEVIRGFHKGVKGYRFNRIHTDWVLQVKYLPELFAFVSCCQTSSNSVCLHQFIKKKSSSYFSVNKGILCFDYCGENNIVVTGGMDHWVRVYNPYVTNKPIFIIKGHTKPISQVAIDSSGDQVISFDKGKNIRVHDLKDQTCLQQLSGRSVKLGRYPLSAVYYNPVTRTLILASTQIGLLQKTCEEEQVAEVVSHNKPVVSALYNKTFNFVVSACQDSVISVWDLRSGDKIIQTVNAHAKIEKGVEVPVEITSMTFDGPQRRVITGARDGSVKVWNFNNGNCLQTFNTPGGYEVSGVLCVQHNIFVTGWSRLVHVYIDGGEEAHRRDWTQRHKEDILCIAHLSPSIIATGSYDGDIVVWSRDTGQAYCTLNASKGIRSVSETKAKSFETQIAEAFTKAEKRIDEEEKVDGVADVQVAINRERKYSILRNNTEVMNRVKENVLLKENKWSRKLNQMNEIEVEHPLLPLFQSNSQEPDESSNEARTRSPTSVNDRKEYDEICKLYESAVESILFLDARDRESSETAFMMTSGAEGWIRAWSIHHNGGLLGQFNAAHKVGESVLSMTTDATNQLLFTGDSLGYIKTWDISEYCTKKQLTPVERAKRWLYLTKTFTFVRFTHDSRDPPASFISPIKLPMNISKRPPPIASMPKLTLKWPLLVNSFRGHMKIINKIEYVENHKLLITASNDCSVRLWTLSGVYIGTFGERWKTIQSIPEHPLPSKIKNPSELRRAGSAQTLKVLNEGQSKLWKKAVNAAILYTKTATSEEEEEEEDFPLIPQMTSYNKDLTVRSDVGHIPKSPVGRLKSKKVTGSEILGKSYKKKMGHKMPPKIDNFVEINSSVGVYHCLPFSELSSEDPADSKAIDDIRQKYYGGQVLAKMKGLETRKQENTGLLELFNKIVERKTVPKGKCMSGRIKRVQKKVQKKSDAHFQDLTLKENPNEKDIVDKILDED